MNSEFEDYLSRQPIRPVPPEWRADILRSAEGVRAESPATPRWREWFWPNPKAWATLAAGCAVSVVLHWTAPSDSPAQASAAPITWEAFVRLHQETEMIARLPDWPPPQPAAPPPRARLNVKYNVT